MPFKLKNSEAIFHRIIVSILVNVSNVKCYVDDVVIHSETEETHVEQTSHPVEEVLIHIIPCGTLNTLLLQKRYSH